MPLYYNCSRVNISAYNKYNLVFTSTETFNMRIPKRIVIVVPGFRTDWSKWEELRNRLTSESGYGPDEAHWKFYDHRCSLLSFGDLQKKGEKLRIKIDKIWTKLTDKAQPEDFEYPDVVLVAHSMGGPLLREAYLRAFNSDIRQPKSPWAQHVTRFVLFSSINRGIRTDQKLWLKFSAWMVRNFPFLSGLQIADLYRGSNFITNLRINWIRHFGALSEAQASNKSWPDGRPIKVPTVIQVNGSKDSLVKKGDSEDIIAMPEAHDLDLDEADHSDVYFVDDSRYPTVKRAFCEQFKKNKTSADTNKKVTQVVFLLHGIRASNVDKWITEIGNKIKQRNKGKIAVVHPNYGYFTAAKFVLPSVRRKNIPFFQDHYTEALAEHPTAKFSIIAHSNGAYILGHSLLSAPAMHFTNIALAGSVLPKDFWNKFEDNRLKSQADNISNHRAERDWPVALLCSALRGLRMRDIGTSGFDGFDGSSTSEVAYYRGGHSDALRPVYYNSLINFILKGTATSHNSLDGDPGGFQTLSNAAPYVAFFAFLAFLAACIWFIAPFDGLWSMFKLGGVVGVAIIIYIILDIV